MDNYLLGNLIREYRERAGISREELAGDFCAVSTLMRIESGEEIPGRTLANELCSTLGLIPPATKRETTSRADIDRAFAFEFRRIPNRKQNGRYACRNVRKCDKKE